ncbi:patatin-like phospholipase family protein [Candidatus Anaplasma sp. TIGMIC]|uniref:patatin-like phospholipase family protein n=1 Tax=Candidatus Anaplasma sp. TIGMIC TaxID=3020713 RepID=UPI002330EA60|nr:patatin-like phospholipase family protein [Candidatus Anaplasma sp. TIGMIC]MDB1135368.1 patatin-like phospholipase family protein [Candidatus Anaplasma sp. TIGMIC]
MAKYILSVDGGGIRGIIAAKVLCEIEKKIQKPAGEVFDLFVGSSVGAIIASALSLRDEKGQVRYTASDILEFFCKFGPSIFSPSVIRKIFSVISGSRFSASGLEKRLKRFFGDTTMGEVRSHLMIPSYDVRMRVTCMIRNWVDVYKDMKVRDVIRAACAAPTIFSPKELVIGGRKSLMIDSGLVANNPSACGYAAIDFLYPGEKVYFLSLGTGNAPEVPTNVVDSLTFWAVNVAPIFLDAGMEAVDYQMVRILGKERYMRVTGILKHASYDFTNASKKNIRDLQQDADRIIEDNYSVINQFVDTYLGR